MTIEGWCCERAEDLTTQLAVKDKEISNLKRELNVLRDFPIPVSREQCAKEIERLKIECDGAMQRSYLVLDAKNYWMDRATSAEAERDQALAEVERLKVFEWGDKDIESGFKVMENYFKMKGEITRLRAVIADAPHVWPCFPPACNCLKRDALGEEKR